MGGAATATCSPTSHKQQQWQEAQERHPEELEHIQIAQQHNLLGGELTDARDRLLAAAGGGSHRVTQLGGEVRVRRIERLQVLDDSALVKLLPPGYQGGGH